MLRRLTQLFVCFVIGNFTAELSAQDGEQQPASIGLTEVPEAKSATEGTDLHEPAISQQPPTIPVKHFAAFNQFSDGKLSPNGKLLAVELEIDDIPTIGFVDMETGKAISRTGTAKDVDLDWFRWAGPNKILLGASQMGDYFGEEARYTALYVFDLQTRKFAYIGRKERVLEGDNVIYVADDGSYVLLSVQRTPYDYPSVIRFELTPDGGEKTVQRPRDGVWQWHADDKGVVRMGTGWLRNRLRVFYRSGPDENMRQIARLKEDDAENFWDVAQIVSGSDEGYVLQAGDNGRVGLRKFNYLTREVTETVYENPDWDVESVLLRKGEPIGVFYTDDVDRVVWFDDEIKNRYARFQKALPQESVWVSSRSKDGSRMLLWAGGVTDPGSLYVFTAATREIAKFSDLRPELNPDHLATPTAITYAARDGLPIRGYLTLPIGREAKDLPMIIMPHGGPYGVRDQLRFDDDVQLLANRGYAVLQPNYRGSSGYGQAFSALGTGQIGRKMQDDLDDAMDWAVGEGIADAKRVCVVGGSYGGYAALWAVIRNPERYRCAASWAGVTDWDSLLRYDRKYFNRRISKKWEARVEGSEGLDLADVSPVKMAAFLERPVLLAHGTEDTRVPFSQFKKMGKAARRAPLPPDMLIIKGEGHSFSSAKNLEIWYAALDAFLAKHNPADRHLPDGSAQLGN